MSRDRQDTDAAADRAGHVVMAFEHIHKRFARGKSTVNALDDVTFAVRENRVTGLIGPDAAGKTTLMRLVAGLERPDHGLIALDKETWVDVSRGLFEPPQRRGVGLVFQDYVLFPHMTVERNVAFAARSGDRVPELLNLFGALYNRRIEPREILELVQLSGKANARPKQLSGGQRQRFSIALALVNDPDILFLDEPTTGLDPQARRNLWNLVRAIHARGKTIVLTTHNMEEAETLCARVAIMDAGRIVALDTPDNLIAAHAPEAREQRLTGTLEDVFLALTGHELRD